MHPLQAMFPVKLPAKIGLLVSWGLGMLLLTSPAMAEPRRLTLPEVLQLAQDNNPDLKAELAKVEAGRGDLTVAGYVPNPQLNIGAGWGQQTYQMGNPQQVNLTLPLETGGKRGLRVRVAKSQLASELATYRHLTWTVMAAVRAAYLEVVVAQAYLDLVDAQETVLTKLVEVTRQRFEAGVAAKVDVLQAELTLDQLELSEQDAESRLAMAKINLNSLLGNSLKEDFTLSSGRIVPQEDINSLQQNDPKLFDQNDLLPPPSDLAHLKDQALTHRMDLQALFQDQQAARHSLSLAKRKRIPDIAFSAGYLFTYLRATYSPTFHNDFFGGPYLGVTMEMPVFHNQQGEIRRAKAMAAQAETQLAQGQQQVEKDVGAAMAQLCAEHRKLQIYQKKLLPNSAEVLNLSRESYRYGKTGLTQVLYAQRDLQVLTEGYLDAVSAYGQRYLKLEESLEAALEKTLLTSPLFNETTPP